MQMHVSLVYLSGPDEPEEKQESGESPNEPRTWVDTGLGQLSADWTLPGQGADPLGPKVMAPAPLLAEPEQMEPPRILERFTPKTVKRHSSVTFSVKVAGACPYPPSQPPILASGSWWGWVSVCLCSLHRTPGPCRTLAPGGGREGRAVDWP